MNPEDQQKPNFENFIVMLLGGETEYPNNIERIEQVRNGILKEWELEWDAILDGEIPYTQNLKLFDLLKDNQLEDFIVDFSFLGYKISEYINENMDYRKTMDDEDKMELELLEALKILYEPKEEIILRFHGRKNKTSISNPELIKMIKESFLDILKKIEYHLQDFPDDDSKWCEYISHKIESQKFNLSFFKGRKEKNPEYKHTINWLQRYLEYNTQYKSNSDKLYSNEQARFIYNFLDIHGLIEDSKEKMNKEDIIGYYIKSEKKSKEKSEQYIHELRKKFSS